MTTAERVREELREGSLRQDGERRRRDLHAERYRFHADQAQRLRRVLENLIAHHETQTEKLLEGTP